LKKKKNVEEHVSKLNVKTPFTKEEIKLLQENFSFSKSDCYHTLLGVINKEDFVRLIECYYSVLKQNDETEAPVFEVTSEMSSRIFDGVVEGKKNIGVVKMNTLSCVEMNKMR
jgi:hypothetical protein